MSQNITPPAPYWKANVVVAAIVEHEGRYLFVQETPDGGPTVYNQPAGHLDFGETLVEAVVRETLEETTWHIAPQGIVGLYMYAKPGTDITYLRVCFHGLALEHDETRPLDRDIVAAHWLTRPELLTVQHQHRSPLVLRCLDDYLAGKRYPLDLLYTAL
jgi:8-oxo-dGTP pyrophosphatase MutT (NUDIX family)